MVNSEGLLDAAARPLAKSPVHVPRMSLKSCGFNENDIVLGGPFRKMDGLTWLTKLPESLRFQSDDDTFNRRSRCVLLEDGRAMHGAHSMHRDIASKGGGQYSHWKGHLIFSTSDGSDPNLNCRTYSISLEPARLQFMGYGSCHVQDALFDLDFNSLAGAVANSIPSRNTLISHYPKATLQQIEFLRGELSIPQVVRRFVYHDPKYEPKARNGAIIDTADVSFVEFATPIEINFRGVWLNRNLIGDLIVDKARARDTNAGEIALKWFEEGLLKVNEKIREEAAQALLEFLPSGTEEADCDRDLVMNARSSRPNEKDYEEGIRAIKDALPMPICILSHTLRFMPDGRPINWPQGFVEQTNTISARLGIPIVNPYLLVEKLGGDVSLKPDLQHFTPEFVSELGMELLVQGIRMSAGTLKNMARTA